MEGLYKYNIKINRELIFHACANFIERFRIVFMWLVITDTCVDGSRIRNKHIHFRE